MIDILLNGERTQTAEGQTILGFLQSLDIQPDRVAVELDRRIVKHADWAATPIRADSQLEIVHFVGGG